MLRKNLFPGFNRCYEKTEESLYKIKIKKELKNGKTVFEQK